MAFFARKRRNEQVDLEDRSPQLGIKYKDLLVLEELRKVGADFQKPRHVLYYLYFADRERAEQASAEAAARGFEVSVREPLPEYPDNWTLVCELHDTVLQLTDVRDNTDLFEGLAVSFGGKFDGWEASAD